MLAHFYLLSLPTLEAHPILCPGVPATVYLAWDTACPCLMSAAYPVFKISLCGTLMPIIKVILTLILHTESLIST